MNHGLVLSLTFPYLCFDVGSAWASAQTSVSLQNVPPRGSPKAAAKGRTTEKNYDQGRGPLTPKIVPSKGNCFQASRGPTSCGFCKWKESPKAKPLIPAPSVLQTLTWNASMSPFSAKKRKERQRAEARAIRIASAHLWSRPWHLEPSVGISAGCRPGSQETCLSLPIQWEDQSRNR